jgi:hypothetical protein
MLQWIVRRARRSPMMPVKGRTLPFSAAVGKADVRAIRVKGVFRKISSAVAYVISAYA